MKIISETLSILLLSLLLIGIVGFLFFYLSFLSGKTMQNVIQISYAKCNDNVGNIEIYAVNLGTNVINSQEIKLFLDGKEINFTGCPKWVSGKYGYGLELDGYDDYILLFKHLQYDLPWTACVWIYLYENLNNKAHAFLDDSDWPSIPNRYSLRFSMHDTNTAGFTHYTIQDYYFSYSFPTNQWKFVCYVGNSSGIYLFVDGKFVEKNSNTIKLPLKFIGHSPLRNFPHGTKGIFDEIRIYGRDLKDSEILSLYQNNEILNGLLHKYNFDEGYGNIIHDLIGSNNGFIYNGSFIYSNPPYLFLDSSKSNLLQFINQSQDFWIVVNYLPSISKTIKIDVVVSNKISSISLSC